jgi:hypothetical protein
LWTNLKQNQRDIITKERQARFATGGGPEKPSTEIDPDVALIAPTLMATAPVLFSSNMNDNEIEGKYSFINSNYQIGMRRIIIVKKHVRKEVNQVSIKLTVT